ncbi:IclR family transcriptional regulator [Nocardioides nitrophenolicus]|uniref:IclR family transcriptional regulator n=1 Tax=Nocardioides nitrophenolicus TaxID=60489 RepID=UPI00195A12BA|nr:IclR family transcriptional regulator [Nocardioides nitrophenolicus]MBM7517690.1 DNA-binding IclR family transcriptional regulator [Nocardioides nitrophenolicus]
MERAPGVVEKVAALLRGLSTAESGTTTTALAAATDQPRATTHRLLESLAAEGLADRDPQTGRWFLGPETYVLGMAAATRYDLTNEARASVLRLAKETGESAFFSVRRGDETVVLLREDGDFPIRSYVLYESARFPLGVVSAGIAILAHLPDREIDAFLARVDLTAEWGPQHSAAAIRRRLAATRRTGWSLNPGHVVEGSWGMAAAVFDKTGRPEWALTLTGVEQRFRRDRQPVLGRLLLEEAHRLSRLA